MLKSVRDMLMKDMLQNLRNVAKVTNAVMKELEIDLIFWPSDTYEYNMPPIYPSPP